MRVLHELEVLKVVKKVESIEITTPPDKTEYMAGEDFDPTGMVVTAVYEDGTSEPITNYIIFRGDKLVQGQADVTIQYDDGSANSGINVKQTITVKPYVGDHRHTYDGGPWYADAKSHWHQCTDSACPDPSGSTKDLASHTFVWKVDKAATETQTGLKHEECTVCGHKRSENTEIPLLPGSGTTEPGNKPGSGTTEPGNKPGSGTTEPGNKPGNRPGGTTVYPENRPDSGTASPKTGDAGIVLYAGLSLLTLGGSGWIVGKSAETRRNNHKGSGRRDTMSLPPCRSR